MKYVPSPTETQGSISGEYTVTGKGHGAGRSMPGFGCVRACLCCGHVCPRISRGGLLNAGILGSISAMEAAWVAGPSMGTKEHVRQSFGATNRE